MPTHHDDRLDPYASMAERYDLFFGSIADHDAREKAFFTWVVNAYHVRRVLDCACGTGRHLHMLHTLGCDITGSDLSPAMLSRAKENLDAAGVVIPLVELDFRELPSRFGREFDAVLCLSSSLLHMATEEDAQAALESMRSVLRPGGILVLTQGTSDDQWRQKPRFILARDDETLTRVFVIDYHGEGASYNVVDVLHHEADKLRVWSTDFAKVLLQDDYDRLLAAAGYASATFYGSWDRAPYAKDSPCRLIVIGQTS